MSKFLKVIVNIFLVCAILIAGAILIPPVMGISTVVVDSTSMDTNLSMGSVTYAKNVNVTELKSGDKVLSENDSKTYAYVIESGDVTTGAYTVQNATNSSAEKETITLRNAVPKIIFTVPLIGYVVMAMQSLEGIIIIGLVVLFVIILFILSELWKKTGDDEDEEDDDEEDEEDEEEENTSATKKLIDTPIVPEAIPLDIPVEQTVEMVTDTPETEEKLSGETKDLDPDKVIMESQAELAAAVAMAQSGEEMPQEAAEPVEEVEMPEVQMPEEIEMPEEIQMPEEDPDSFVPIPRSSLDEMLAQAKADGDEPEIVKDEQSGVTILDYSDII